MISLRKMNIINSSIGENHRLLENATFLSFNVRNSYPLFKESEIKILELICRKSKIEIKNLCDIDKKICSLEDSLSYINRHENRHKLIVSLYTTTLIAVAVTTVAGSILAPEGVAKTATASALVPFFFGLSSLFSAHLINIVNQMDLPSSEERFGDTGATFIRSSKSSNSTSCALEGVDSSKPFSDEITKIADAGSGFAGALLFGALVYIAASPGTFCYFAYQAMALQQQKQTELEELKVEIKEQEHNLALLLPESKGKIEQELHEKNCRAAIAIAEVTEKDLAKIEKRAFLLCQIKEEIQETSIVQAALQFLIKEIQENKMTNENEENDKKLDTLCRQFLEHLCQKIMEKTELPQGKLFIKESTKILDNELLQSTENLRNLNGLPSLNSGLKIKEIIDYIESCSESFNLFSSTGLELNNLIGSLDFEQLPEKEKLKLSNHKSLLRKVTDLLSTIDPPLLDVNSSDCRISEVLITL